MPAFGHLWPGVPLALASATLFGASTPLAKLLLGSMGPWLLAGLLYLGAGLGLTVLLAVRRIVRGRTGEAPLRREYVPRLLLMILAGGIAGPLLLMVGLSRTTAADTSLLLNLEGVATLAIAWLVFRENVDRRLLLGAVLILGGAAVLSFTDGKVRFELGTLAIAGACLMWGIDNNVTRGLSAADPVLLALLKGLVAGVVNLTLALSFGASWPAAGTVAGAAVLGFLGYGVSLVLFVLALRHLGAARSGAYFALAPFMGAVLSVVLLNEAWTMQLLVAAALMGGGLWLHLAERHEHPHDHVQGLHDHRHVHDAHHRHAHAPDAPAGEPHSHVHRHPPLVHSHPHYPDLHHRHAHPH